MSSLPKMSPLQVTEVSDVLRRTPHGDGVTRSYTSTHHLVSFLFLPRPRVPSHPSFVQVCVGVDFSPHLAARLLLSDKVHKLWCVVTPNAIERFQTHFPEFSGPGNWHKLSGGILLPTRFALQMHPNLAEFILHLEEFEYKGGAGNNEFAQPIFHAAGEQERSARVCEHGSVCVSPLACDD